MKSIVDAGSGSSAPCHDGAPGRPIRFATAPTTIGWVLLAATNRGVCAIEIGDTPGGVGPDPELAAWLGEVVAAIEAPGRGLDLPMDIRGTAFQRQVWEALRAIPPGSTASYAEIARRIGSPKGVRAVGGACASNPVALVIPCHRAIRSDGSLGGYRWGLDRKRAILDREAESARPRG